MVCCNANILVTNAVTNEDQIRANLEAQKRDLSCTISELKEDLQNLRSALDYQLPEEDPENSLIKGKTRIAEEWAGKPNEAEGRELEEASYKYYAIFNQLKDNFEWYNVHFDDIRESMEALRKLNLNVEQNTLTNNLERLQSICKHQKALNATLLDVSLAISNAEDRFLTHFKAFKQGSSSDKCHSKIVKIERGIELIPTLIDEMGSLTQELETLCEEL